MGVSSRPRARPRTRPTQSDAAKLKRAQKKTIKAAQSARAHGLLTEVGLDHIADGKVDSKDLHRAERILEKAEDLLCAIEHDPDMSTSNVKVAEERVDVAQALLDAIDDQLDKQGNRRGGPTSYK
jgi:hypothetical protein